MSSESLRLRLNRHAIVDPYLWLTLLLSLPVLGPLLQPGYYWGAHDARHSVYFLHQFNETIRDGVWYPRWAPDFAFGYGYPFFNVYGPLSSYAGEALHLLGLDLVTAVKAVFGLSALLSGLTMYLFVRRLLGRPAGLIAALTYVYIPYHLFDLYVRAALAESVGFVFVPLVLWGFYEAATQPHLMAVVGAGLAYAALMLTHSLSAFVLATILGLYVAYMILWRLIEALRQPTLVESGRQFGRTGGSFLIRAWRCASSQRYLAPILVGIPPLGALLLGLGLSAIYLLPSLAEASFVRTDQWFGGRFAFGDDFVEVFQLFSPHWGFGASIPGPDDDTGFQIGLAATVLFIFSFVIVPKMSHPRVRHTLYFFQGTSLVMAFLTTPISNLVWEVLPLAQLVQFPWRLLLVVAPFVSTVAGVIMARDSGQSSTVDGRYGIPLPVVILSGLILLSSYPYLQAEVRAPKPTEGPVSQAALFRFQQSADEMTGQTAWVRYIPNWSTLAEQVERGGEITTKVNYSALPGDNSVGVYSMEMSSVHELLWVGAEEAGQVVTFFVPYYPGWRAYIYEDLGPHDGNLDENVGPVTRIGAVVAQPAIMVTPREGWMAVPIPQGSHFVEIRFEDTPIRAIGGWVSIWSILIAVGLMVIARRVQPH